jgi:hypothetical protein
VVSTHLIGCPKCYWAGLDEAPSGTREDYRGALRHINGDSAFTQPPLNVVEDADCWSESPPFILVARC